MSTNKELELRVERLESTVGKLDANKATERMLLWIDNAKKKAIENEEYKSLKIFIFLGFLVGLFIGAITVGAVWLAHYCK